MPEAPEINVLVNQLKDLLKDQIYNNEKVIDVIRDKKTILIIIENKGTIRIHLMLKGYISLSEDKYTKFKINFSNSTIYINDPINLVTVEINASPFINDDLNLLYYIKKHPNMMTKTVLIKCKKMGIGRYLLKECLKILKENFKITGETKCKDIDISIIPNIEKSIEELIDKITKAGGKHTFRDLYGTYGTYHPN